jgi:hypothetical protein
VNTHLPDFTASAAGLLAAALPAGFGAGFLAALFKGLRALAAAALPRAGTDSFDFAAVFFGLATALAMTADIREEGGMMRAIHHVWAVPRKARSAFRRYR